MPIRAARRRPDMSRPGSGVLAGLPGHVERAVRHALADQLHLVVLAGLPLVALVLLATLAIPVVPLRETVHTPDEARREYLDSMAQSSRRRDELVLSLSEGRTPRTRERILGIQFSVLMNEAMRDDRPFLRGRSPRWVPATSTAG